MRKFTIMVMAALLTMGSGQICAQSTEQASDGWTEVYTRTYDDNNADNADGIASTGKHEGTAVAWVGTKGCLKFGTDEFRNAKKWKVTMDVASTSTDVKVWLKKNSTNLGNDFDGLEFYNWFDPSTAEADLVWHQLTLVGDAATGKVTMTITNSKDGAWDNGKQLGDNFQNIDEFGFYGLNGVVFFDNVRCYVGASEVAPSDYVTVADDNFDDNVVPARFRGAWNRHALMNHGTGRGLYVRGKTDDAKYLASATDVTSDGWRLTADLAFRTQGGGGIYFKEGGTNVITLLPTANNATTLKLSGDKVGTNITIPGNHDKPKDENLIWTTVVLTGSKSKGQITFSAKNSNGEEIVKETVVNSFKNINNIGFWVCDNSFAYLDNVKYELATDATVPVTVTDAGQATYTSLLPLDFSKVEGLKAYTATSYADAKLTMTKVDKAPAMTGLVVKAASGKYIVPVTALTTTTAPETNLLKGVVENTIVKATEGNEGEYTNFFLTAAGFAPAVKESNLAAGKAYLQLPTSSKPTASAKIAMVFSDENETTAITSAKADVKVNDTVYDLQGRIVRGQLQRGIYIRGGKKFIVK